LSSILKALKKLEDEDLSPVGEQSWLKELRAEEPVDEGLKQKLITHRRIYAICAAVLLVLAGGWVVIEQTDLFSKTPAPKRLAKPFVETKSPVTALQNRVKVPPPPFRTAGPDRKVSGTNHAQLPSRVSENKALNKTVPISNRITAKTPIPRAETFTGSLRPTPTQPAGFKSLKSLPDTRAVKRLPAAETDTPGIKAPEISKLDQPFSAIVPVDTDLQLQAISWSEHPQKRLAVINNRIVRQGDRVDGYSIDRINQDDVMVKQGNKILKLIFGAKKAISNQP